jgi:hypothetical protein
MAGRVFLHIGTMKSATSHLRELFNCNVDLLAAHGIRWQSARSNQMAVHDFMRSHMRRDGYEGAWRRFSRQVRDEPGDVLISMELLAPLSPARVERFAKGLGSPELKVILTVRDLTKAIPSHWQEKVQNRETASWAEWVAAMCASDPADPRNREVAWRQHYLPGIVRTWSTVAAGKVSVVTVPRDASDPSLVWRRFASVLGVPSERFAPPIFGNPALGGLSAELMRRVNESVGDLDFQQYRWGFKAALAKNTLAAHASAEPRPALTLDQHRRLREITMEMLAELEKVDVELVGDIEDLIPSPEPPAQAYDPGCASADDLLGVAILGLAGLGRRVAALERERDELARQGSGAVTMRRAAGSRGWTIRWADGMGVKRLRNAPRTLVRRLPGKATPGAKGPDS